jgi:hypothetical protein
MDENDDKPEDLGCFPRFADKPIFVLYVYIYMIYVHTHIYILIN